MPRYALVIGIAQYSRFRHLPKAAADAEAIATCLEQHHYSVTRLPRKLVGENQWRIDGDRPLTAATLNEELKIFLRERATHQDVIIYIASHGFQAINPTTDEEEGYLATSDSTLDGLQAVRFENLNTLLSRAKLGSLVLLLDCCYAGSLLEQQNLLQPTQTTISQHQNYCLIAACRAFEQAREGKTHGIFTAAVLKGLSLDNAVQGEITSNDLFGFVSRELKTSGQEVVHAGMGQAIPLVSYAPVASSNVGSPMPTVRVFISYRSQAPDSELAEEFYHSLTAAGHSVFMAVESIRLGDNWSQRIDQELERCDYFLLLLSPKSAVSEMVTEEVRRARELRHLGDTGKPVILPIRVNFPMDSPLNYDLRGYLNRIQQREWRSPADTPQILQEILTILAAPDGAERPESLAPQEPLLHPTPLPEHPDSPPVPVAEPELPGGQVELSSLYYVERPPRERNCYETILKPGALIRIKAPRQMGKTSLMSRVLRHAEGQGYLTVPLSFQLADAAIFADLDKFLRWFCASVGRRLRSPNKLNDYWDDIFGSKDNCTAYFEEYLLLGIDVPLVLGLDEVDRVFQYPQIADDFLGLLRAWYETAKTKALWKKLRLIVVHSTEVYIPMNINQSPFNVGLPIELPEFTPEQVLDLARRHGLTWGDPEVTRLMAMVGGHPYLVRVALYQIARREIGLDELLQVAPTEAGPYGDHLRSHLWNLEQRPEMAAAAKRLISSSNPIRLEPVQAIQLQSMGIAHLQDNEVVPRCNLYRLYFGDRLTVRDIRRS